MGHKKWLDLQQFPSSDGIDVFTCREDVCMRDVKGLVTLSAIGYEESELMHHFTRGNLDALPLYQTILLNAVLVVGGWVTAIRSRESEKIIATAWWLPPGIDMPVVEIAKSLPSIYKKFGLKSFFIVVWSFLKVIYTELLARRKYGLNKKKPCALLVNIVVYKEYRGQRYAATLLEPVLEWADQNDVVLYLEADGITNIEYVYPSFGFKIFRWIKLLDRSVKYAAMIRFPKNS